MFVNVPSSISLVSKGMGNWAPQSRNQFQQRAIMRRHISGMGATVCYDGDAGEECYDDGTGSGGGGSSIDIPVYTGDPGTSPAGGGAIQISQNGSFAGGGTYSCTGNTCDLTPAGGGAKTSMTPSQIASLVAVAGQTANGVYRSLQSPYLILERVFCTTRQMGRSCHRAEPRLH